MKCLRCGYCCKHYSVVIVSDPSLGVVSDNLVCHPGDGRACPHLRGDGVGRYSCAVYSYDWYSDTPCFAHGQVESSSSSLCRMGVYQLKKAGLWKGLDIVCGDK